MTGTLHANTIEKANGDPVELTGQIGLRAYASTANGAAPGDDGGFNVGSVTDNGTGDYTYTLSASMAGIGSPNGNGNDVDGWISVSSSQPGFVRLRNFDDSAALKDAKIYMQLAGGDMA
jgi:hypothetical protein